MKDIEIEAQKFISVSSIVSKAFDTRDILEPKKPLDYGAKPKRKVIGKEIVITITTSDGAKHTINEPYSRAAYPILYPGADIP